VTFHELINEIIELALIFKSVGHKVRVSIPDQATEVSVDLPAAKWPWS
jgi:hypothetical protein